MKCVGTICSAVLSLSFGIGIPAYAQQEQHEQQEENKDKPAQEKEKKAEPAKPEEKNARQQEKNERPEEKNVRPEERNAQEQRTQEARPGKQEQQASGRIPDDRYKANFGREHHFRVSETDYRSRRFQYGGYSFGFVDAWPSNWLYSQDVFVVEIDGRYYLCNASYPGVNLALSITL